jgi:hypothetical protein
MLGRRAVGLLALAFTLAGFAGCGSKASNSTNVAPQKTTPTITWPTPAAIMYGTALSSTQLDATASVAGAFVYSPSVGAMPKAGTQTLSAEFIPADTTQYTIATSSVQLTVKQATPTVSWPIPAAITYGTALGGTQLNATASVPGTFVYNPIAGTVLTVGTQTIFVGFTPTDTVDYASVSTSVSIVVNPAVPTLTGFTPRYNACDSFCYFVDNYVVTCAGCQNGDIVHDASGLFTPSDFTLSLAAGGTSFGVTLQWQPGSYQPWFFTIEAEHPGGPYGNQWSTAFLGSGSQSTLAVSPKTGTLFQIEEASGHVHMLKTDGTTGSLGGGSAPQTPVDIAVDDVSGNVAYLWAATQGSIPPEFGIYGESQSSPYALCYGAMTGMSYVSSIAAKGDYVVFTDPGDNLVGVASSAGCSPTNPQIGYQTIPVVGQPWAVAMVNGTELDVYVLSRDKWSTNGLPGLTKIRINSDGTTTVMGSVELTGFTPVSVVRASNALAGIYQVVAFSQQNTAAVLFMSSASDGVVLTISTDTSNGKSMTITHTVPITAGLPIGIATQESASSSALWVAYILANSGEAVTHIGAIDLTTGSFTSGIGVCQTGVLAGGFIATGNGVYCAQGAVIASPLALQP